MKMQRGEYYIESNDGLSLFFRFWKPVGSDVCVCILHGWGTHSGLYNFLAQYFAQSGISVTAIDLRGHGNSAGKASNIRHITAFDLDVEALLRESNKVFPQSKKILMGHQLGALVALQYYLLHKKDIDALILSAPLFKTAVKIPASWWLKINLWARIFPFFSVDVSRYLGINLSELKGFEGNLPPLMHVKLVSELRQKGQKMITQGYKLNVPTLIIHGTDDNIALHKSSVVFSRNTGYYTTFKSWPGKNHYLTEIQDIEVLEYLLNWIKQNTHLHR
jgi:alpha-beta hydrolase superfamily lysophospholipase